MVRAGSEPVVRLWGAGGPRGTGPAAVGARGAGGRADGAGGEPDRQDRHGGDGAVPPHVARGRAARLSGGVPPRQRRQPG
ncbi:MAG TPA: hypothetical protein ENI87_02235 [bacterium]|nr:hypothetical protein [bacterium]